MLDFPFFIYILIEFITVYTSLVFHNIVIFMGDYQRRQCGEYYWILERYWYSTCAGGGGVMYMYWYNRNYMYLHEQVVYS